MRILKTRRLADQEAMSVDSYNTNSTKSKDPLSQSALRSGRMIAQGAARGCRELLCDEDYVPPWSLAILSYLDTDTRSLPGSIMITLPSSL